MKVAIVLSSVMVLTACGESQNHEKASKRVSVSAEMIESQNDEANFPDSHQLVQQNQESQRLDLSGGVSYNTSWGWIQGGRQIVQGPYRLYFPNQIEATRYCIGLSQRYPVVNFCKMSP